MAESYITLDSSYSAIYCDTDNMNYIKQYYQTNINFFWNIFNTSLTYDYYNRVNKIIKNI